MKVCSICNLAVARTNKTMNLSTRTYFHLCHACSIGFKGDLNRQKLKSKHITFRVTSLVSSKYKNLSTNEKKKLSADFSNWLNQKLGKD